MLESVCCKCKKNKKRNLKSEGLEKKVGECDLQLESAFIVINHTQSFSIYAVHLVTLPAVNPVLTANAVRPKASQQSRALRLFPGGILLLLRLHCIF